MIRFQTPAAGGVAPLSDDDLERLDALLDALDTDDALIAEELDGFIAALVCMPEVVDLAWVLAYAMGRADDAQIDTQVDVQVDVQVDMPANARRDPDAQGGDGKPADDESGLQALVAHHVANVVDQLERGEYSPLLSYDEQGRADGSAWAAGFLQAVELYPDSWDALVEEKEFADALDAIEAVAATLDDEHPRRLGRREHDALIDQMIFDVADIHEFFRPYRQAGTTPAALRVEAVRRAQPKVGRNEPCPCGSGRKYKLCCGAARP